jgi:hypothetical protein
MSETPLGSRTLECDFPPHVMSAGVVTGFVFLLCTADHVSTDAVHVIKILRITSEFRVVAIFVIL